jgi:hypothetical protein
VLHLAEEFSTLARAGRLPLIAAVRSKWDLEADLPNPKGAPVTVLPFRTGIRAHAHTGRAPKFDR